MGIKRIFGRDIKRTRRAIEKSSGQVFQDLPRSATRTAKNTSKPFRILGKIRPKSIRSVIRKSFLASTSEVRRTLKDEVGKTTNVIRDEAVKTTGAIRDEAAKTAVVIQNKLVERIEQETPKVLGFGIGALFAMIGLLLLIVFLVQLLAELANLPAWGAYLLVGAAFVVASIVIFQRSRYR